MLKPPRLRQGDKIAIVAPASSFAREEFDKGSRGDSAARLRAGLRGERVCAARRLPVRRSASAGAGISQRLAGSVSAGAHRGSWRLWKRAPAAVSGTRGPAPHAEGVHRIQRSDDGPLVPHRQLRHRLVPRADARSQVEPGNRRLRSRLIRSRADERGAARRDRRVAARDYQQGRSGGSLDGRARLRSWWRRLGHRMPSIRQPVTCCL